MVIGLVGKVANVGIRAASKYFKELHRIDVKVHRGLYGATAGRGVRHGRDAGIFISQYIKGGDDLDDGSEIPEQAPPGKGVQARDRRQRRYNGRYSKYNRFTRQRCRSDRYIKSGRYR